MSILHLKKKSESTEGGGGDDRRPVGHGPAHRAPLITPQRIAIAVGVLALAALTAYAYMRFGISRTLTVGSERAHGLARSTTARSTSTSRSRVTSSRAPPCTSTRSKAARSRPSRRGGRVRQGRPAARRVQEHESAVAGHQRRGASASSRRTTAHESAESDFAQTRLSAISGNSSTTNIRSTS